MSISKHVFVLRKVLCWSNQVNAEQTHTLWSYYTDNARFVNGIPLLATSLKAKLEPLSRLEVLTLGLPFYKYMAEWALTDTCVICRNNKIQCAACQSTDLMMVQPNVNSLDYLKCQKCGNVRDFICTQCQTRWTYVNNINMQTVL